MKTTCNEREIVLILCQPEYRLSKVAIDYLETKGKGLSLVILMLEDADIKLFHGVKNRTFEVLETNIRENKTKEILIVARLDQDRYTKKEHLSFLEGSMRTLSSSFPHLIINGMSYNGATEKYYVYE